MEYRLRPATRSPAFPPSPLQRYLATPNYKGSFNRRSYQYSPRSMHRVTYLNGQKAKIYNTAYLYPEVENPESRVDLIGKQNRLLLITPRRHRSFHDLSSSPKKSQSLFESTNSHGSSSLSVPTSPFLSRRFGSEPYRSYSYQELYSPRSPSTPRRPLFSSRRTYSTSDLLYTSPTSRDRFYYDYPLMSNYRRWTSNYDISYVPDQYRSTDALYGHRKAGSFDVLYPPSPSYFDFRAFSRSESGYGGYEFRSRSGSGSIIRSTRSDIGDYHHTSRSEYDFPLRLRHDLGDYRPATRSECDFPMRHRGPESKSECGVSPNDIATRSESGFSITLSDFDNSFSMADDEVCSIGSVEHSHDRSLDNLLMFPMSDDHDRLETDSVVSHDRTLDIINEDENSDQDQDVLKKPGKPAASVSLLSRFEQADRKGKTTLMDMDDDVFRQHTDTLYLTDGGNRIEDELNDAEKYKGGDSQPVRAHRNEDEDVLTQHTDTFYLTDGANITEEENSQRLNDEEGVRRQHTDTVADGGHPTDHVNERMNDDGDVVRHHTDTIYFSDGPNAMLEEHDGAIVIEGEDVRNHTDTLYLFDGANTQTHEDKSQNKGKDGELRNSDPTKDISVANHSSRIDSEEDDTIRHHTDTLYFHDGTNSQLGDGTFDSDRSVTSENNKNKDVRSLQGDVAGSDGFTDKANCTPELVLNSDDDTLRHHSDTLYLYDGGDSRIADGATSTSNSANSISDKSSRTDVSENSAKVSMILKHGAVETQDDVLRDKTETLYIQDSIPNTDTHAKGTNENLRQQSQMVTASQTAEIHQNISPDNLKPVPDSEDRVDNKTHQTTSLHLHGHVTGEMADTRQSHVVAALAGESGLEQHTSEVILTQTAENPPTASLEVAGSDPAQVHAVTGEEDSELRQHSETLTISHTSEVGDSGAPENVSNIKNMTRDNLDNVRHQTTTLYIHGEKVDVMADTPERRTQSTVSEAERDLMQTSYKITLSQSAEVQHTNKPETPTTVVTAVGKSEQLQNVGHHIENDRLQQHTETVKISHISEIHRSGKSEDVSKNAVDDVDNVGHTAETVYVQNGDTYVKGDIPERRTQSVITEAQSNLTQHTDNLILSQSGEVHHSGLPIATANTMTEPEVQEVKTMIEDEVLRQHTDAVTIVQTPEIHESETSDDVTNLTNSGVRDSVESIQYQSNELYTHGERVDVMADTPERRMQAKVSEETDQLRKHTDTVTITQTTQVREDKPTDNKTYRGDGVHLISDTPERRMQADASEETDELRQTAGTVTVTQTAEVCDNKPTDNKTNIGDNIHLIADTPERRQQAKVSEETDQLKQLIDTVTISQTSEIHQSDSVDNLSNLPAGTAKESVDTRHQTQTLHLHGDSVDMLPDTPERRLQAHMSKEEIELRKNSGSRALTHAEELRLPNSAVDKMMTNTPERVVAAMTDEDAELRRHTETIVITHTSDIHQTELSEKQPNANKSKVSEERLAVVAGEYQGNQTHIHQLEDTEGLDKESVEIQEDMEESDDQESDENDENVNEHRKLVYVESDSGQNVEKSNHFPVQNEESDEIAEEASELDDYEVVNVPSEDVEKSDLKSVITASADSQQPRASEIIGVKDSKSFVQALTLTDSEDRVDMLKSHEIMESAEFDFESSGEILATAESRFVNISVSEVSQIEKSDEYEVIDGPEPLFTSSTIVEPSDRHRYLIQDKTDPDEIDESDPVYSQNISAEYERADHDIWEEFIDEREVTTSSQVHLAEEDSDSTPSVGQRSPEDISDNTSDDSDNEQLSSHRQLSQSVDNSLSIKSSLSIDNSLSIPEEGSRLTESLDISLDVNNDNVNKTDGSVADNAETIENITAESRSVHRIGEIIIVDNLSDDSTNKAFSVTEDGNRDNVAQSVTDILDSDKSPGIRMDENKAPMPSSKLPAVTRAIGMKTDSSDLLIDEKSRGEVEVSPSGKIKKEKPGADDSQGAEDRLEEADVRLVKAEVDFVNQKELTTITADQPRLKRWAETQADNKISTKCESSNAGEHENTDSIQEEDIPGNQRLEVHNVSKHVGRDAKLELPRSGKDTHVENGERGSRRESTDKSESTQSISPAANTDTDSQGRGNLWQSLETENVDYGWGSHPSEGSVPRESRVVVGGDVNRKEEIDSSEGGSEKNKSEESGARIDGKTESREELPVGNSSDIIKSIDRVESFIKVGKTSEKTSSVGKSSEKTLSFGCTSEDLDQEVSPEDLTKSEETLSAGVIKIGGRQSQSGNLNIVAVSTVQTFIEPDERVQSISGAEVSDALISSDLAESTVKCALTTLAHSGETGTIQIHSNVTECATGTLRDESQRNLTGDITQIHYIEPNLDNRQTSYVELVTASIEDSPEQADILNVTGGVLHKPAIVEGDNVYMQQIHESPQLDLVSRVDIVTQDKMAGATSVTEGTDTRVMADASEDGGFGDKVTRFVDRTEMTLPLEKKAIIKTKVQYRVKKLTKMVTKTDVDVKKVKKKTTGDAVEHEHLQKVEQLTVVSQKVWSSTESLDKDEPLEERCQIAYKATFDKTQEKDGQQLPSAHFETSYAGEIPLGMQAIHGESTEDILALCGPETDNAESSRTSGPMMQRGIDNAPAIHISQFTGAVGIEENVTSGETEMKNSELSEVKSTTEVIEEAVKSPSESQTVELIDDSRNRSINLEAGSSEAAYSNTIRSQTPDENNPDMNSRDGETAHASANSEIDEIKSSEFENTTKSELRDEKGASPTHTDRIEIFISPKSLSPVTLRRHRWSAERRFTDDKLICTLYEETVRDVTTADDSALYILEDNIHLPIATERLETFVKLPSKKTFKPKAPAAKPLWTFELASLTPLTAQTGQVDADGQAGVASLALSTVNNTEVTEQRLESDECDVKVIRNSEKREDIQENDREGKAKTSDVIDSSGNEKKENITQNIDRSRDSERKEHVAEKTELFTENNNNEQKIQNINDNSVNFDEDSFNQVLSNILSGKTTGQQSTLIVTSISHTSEMYSSNENMNEAELREAPVSETSEGSLPSASDSKQGLTVHGDVRSLDQLPDTADVEDARKFPDTDYTSLTETKTYGDDGENNSIFLDGGSTEHEIERTEEFVRFESGNKASVQVVRDRQFSNQIGIEDINGDNSKLEKVNVGEERQEDIDIESASEIAESERVVESSERETVTSGEEGDDESDETNNNDKLGSVHESRWVDRTNKLLNIDTTETAQVYVKNAETVRQTDKSESHLNLTLSDSRDGRDEVSQESSETLSEDQSDRSGLKGDKEVVSAQESYPNKSRAEREEGEDLSSCRETNRDSLFRGAESTDLRDSPSARLSHPTHTSQFSTHSPRCEIRGDNDSNISLQEGDTSGGNDKPSDIGDIIPDHDNTSVSVDISDSHAPVNTGLSDRRVFTSSGEWKTQIHGSRTEYKAVETGDSIDEQQTIPSAPSAQVDSSTITSGLAYSESSEVGKLNAGTSGLNSSSLESAAVNDGMLINGQSLVEQHTDDQKYANVTRALAGNENSILKEAETFGGSSRHEIDVERAVTVRGELDVSRDAHANIGESDNESSENNRDDKIEQFKGAFIKFSLEDLPLHLKQRYESMDEQRARLTSVTDTQSEEIEYSSEMSHFDYDDWTRSEAAQEQIRSNKSTDDGLRFSSVKMGDITSSDEINRSKDSDTSFDRLEWLESVVHTDDANTWQNKSSRVSVLVTGQVDSETEENNNYEKEMEASYAEDSDNSDLDTSGSQYSATVTCELRDGQRNMSPTSLDERSLSVSEHMFGEFRDLPDGKSRLLSSASSDGYFSSASDQMTGELRMNVSSDAHRHYSSTSSEGYPSFISDQMMGELKHSPSSDVQKISPSTFDEIEDTLNNSLMELENLSLNLSNEESDAGTHNMSDHRTSLSSTTSFSGPTQRISEIGSSMKVVGGEAHRSVSSESRGSVRFVTENVQQSGYVSSSVKNLEQGQFQDVQVPSSEDRGHYLTTDTATRNNAGVYSENVTGTDQTEAGFSQKYSSSDHVTRMVEQGGTEIPTWSPTQGVQTVYTQRAGDQSVQRQFHAVDPRGGQISGQKTQFSKQTFNQNTQIHHAGIIAGNLSSEERRHQVGVGGQNTQGYSSISSSMSDQSRSMTDYSQSRTLVSSEHSQHTIMSTRDTETYENVPDSMSESVKDELLKKSHGYFSSSVSVNLSKKWKMFEKLYHSFDEFSWQGNLAPHLFTFVFQKSVENQTDVVDQFEKLYPLLLIEDVERCQNHICTVLYTDTYLKQRKMQKYFLRGFTKDLKHLWHTKRKQSLAPLCDIPEERIVSFSDTASVSLPTCHTTSIHPSLVSFQPVAKPQFNRFLQQGDAVDTSTSDKKEDNSFDSGEGNSCDSLQYICQGDLSDPTIMLSKRLQDLSRGDNSDILDDVLLRGLRNYRSKFIRFNPYMQVDRKGVRRTIRTETIYEEEEDERCMD